MRPGFLESTNHVHGSSSLMLTLPCLSPAVSPSQGALAVVPQLCLLSVCLPHFCSRCPVQILQSLVSTSRIAFLVSASAVTHRSASAHSIQGHSLKLLRGSQCAYRMAGAGYLSLERSCCVTTRLLATMLATLFSAPVCPVCCRH